MLGFHRVQTARKEGNQHQSLGISLQGWKRTREKERRKKKSTGRQKVSTPAEHIRVTLVGHSKTLGPRAREIGTTKTEGRGCWSTSNVTKGVWARLRSKSVADLYRGRKMCKLTIAEREPHAMWVFIPQGIFLFYSPCPVLVLPRTQPTWEHVRVLCVLLLVGCDRGGRRTYLG